MSQTSNNKRIAKNTLLLYFRMILIMGVTLYTSRVVLKQLGVEDFGIYNIIAGVVVLFSFLSNALISSTQRYLSIAIGRKNRKEIQTVFSVSLVVHILLILIVLILSETVGLWFVNSKLEIPSNRMYATNVIYQLTILTTILNIIRIPYNASIIANEKMSFFAYVSIAEAIFKLLIVWMLMLFGGDKLINYCFLLLLVVLIINYLYYNYCNKYLFCNKFIIKYEKNLLAEMISFSGWNLFGGIADVSYKQGTNIILNLFFGVGVNAALGITNQIRGAIFSFVGNLQTAANPQIIKAYAVGDYRYFNSLVYRISKYSYFLVFIIAIPVIFNIDLILEIWLEKPPIYTAEFSILTLCICLIDSLVGPLWTSMQACGRIKWFQIITSSCLLLNLPLSLVFLYLDFSVYVVFYIQIIISVLTLVIRIIFTKKTLNFSIKKYLREVMYPIFLVTIIIIPILLFTNHIEGSVRLLYYLGINVITCLLIYFLGSTKEERQVIASLVINRLPFIQKNKSL